MRKSEVERFFEKVKKTDTCWFWTGTKVRHGYGNFFSITFSTNKFGNCSAHRWSFHHHFGSIPKDKLICHKCDNPSCVRPDHLYLGTFTDNNRDTVNRGRHVSYYKNKTHCKRGHEFNSINTYIKKDGSRRCNPCKELNRKMNLNKKREINEQ